MVKVKGLYKTFRSGRGEVKAIQDVCFEVEEGRNLVVIGKSGSGKTTLLNCIGGLERTDSGTVRCEGVEVTALSPKALSLFQRRHVGFVFQFGNLIPYLTVSENIAFPLVLNGVDAKERSLRVAGLLEKIGLPVIGRALPDELSGGEIQRVAFARAIAHRPGILLADEPTASLDSKTGQELIALMFSLAREQRCTTIVATHDPEIIAAADDKLVLKDGHREI